MDEPVRTIPAVRSTQGCWTCRLRRKKCDEVRPECNRCVSVNVTCCYGPKPRWMENDVRAKAELEKIKKIVGASASRKRAAFREKTRATIHSTESLSPQSPHCTPESRNRSHDFPSLPAISSLLSYHPRDSQSPRELSETKAFPYPKWAEDHEASLMMHYLDNVFFIQFRFHTPSVSTGGRGWLLSLLTRTKPLYHAALSLSAFHQQSVLCIGQEGSQAQTNTLQELERHHNLTLQELQVFIHAHSSNGNALGVFGGNIQILACMVQLISFELFNGGTSNWQVHLKAASALVLALHGIPETNKRDHPAFQREPLSSHHFHFPERPSPHGPLSSEHAALNFLTGAIIWFDILACVSLDSKPHLSEHQSERLSMTAGSPDQEHPTDTKIELSTIMGCQNWCMMIISEIAQLVKEKENASIQSEQLITREHEIRHRLEVNTSQVRKQLDEIRVHYNGPPPTSSPEIYNKHTIYVVTNIFACAALIYLQNIISFPCHLSLRQQTMSAFELIPDPRMIRGLVWPLCIAGCMAQTESDRTFFKDLATTAISDSRTFGNSGKALEILEVAWELQEQSLVKEPADCRIAIRRMGSCVLLV